MKKYFNENISEECKQFKEQAKNLSLYDNPFKNYKQIREFERQMCEKQPYQAPKGIRLERTVINGVDVEWTWNDKASRDAILFYVHGGAFVGGSIESMRAFVADIAIASGINAVSIGYRLAPENSFPAPIEDCSAVYRGLLEQGIPAKKITIAADSAGGTITLGTVLWLKDNEYELPASVVVLSPITDFKGLGNSVKTKNDADPMLGGGRINFEEMSATYGPKVDKENPYFSPLYGNYKGFPPLYIVVGTDEILLDDSIRLEEKAEEANVDVNLHIWDGLVHCFMQFAQIPEAGMALKEMTQFIKKFYL